MILYKLDASLKLCPLPTSLYHIAILRIGAKMVLKHAVINILTLTGH
jgi:hypothetical protein